MTTRRPRTPLVGGPARSALAASKKGTEEDAFFSHGTGEGKVLPEHRNDGGKKPGNIITFPSTKGRSRWKYCGAVGLALALACVMILALYSPLLGLKTIRVTGLKLVTEQQIDAALAPLRDRPLPQVTDQSVTDLLGPIVAIKDLSVYRKPPHSMELYVEERVPVAVIRNNSGFVLVDVDGVQLSSATDRAGIDLPLIDGGSAVVGHDIFKAVMTVISELPQEIAKQTDHVRANTVSTVELVLRDGKVVVWGDAKQGDLKSRALSILLADPRIRAEVHIVDVSAPRIPVTKN